ncbi:MAG: NAD(P)/FAD-dependent oxidoreductase [Syntrophaceae bacterium]|nr:NAD(P)/FAD-dependent oxidoreductase [Syntrophaceae bacterium]
MSFARDHYDAVVVGAGPNGLAAAITLTRRFRHVLLVEAADTVGGGARSAALTLPGFVHDVCSAVHPLALSSPFFRQLGLERLGLEWVHPEIPLAHAFEGGGALCLHRSLEETAEGLGPDGGAYRMLIGPFAQSHERLLGDVLKPLPLPAHPFLMARFGLKGLRTARGLAEAAFRQERTRALFAGLAAHAIIPLERAATAVFGILLAVLAHGVGWPVVRGGSQRLADALAECFRQAGGEIRTGLEVRSVADLPRAERYLFDVTPRQLLAIEGLGLSEGYRAKLSRFRYGPGVCKVDWALSGPIPWEADACRRAGTVHLGGSLGEIAASVRDAHEGRVCRAPYVVLAQQSLFDPTRAPAGCHTAWAYCHVPNGSPADMTETIEQRIERCAPGFRGLILARSSMPAPAMERHNANYVGGDINGGVQDLRQLYSRPVLSLFPYRTSNPKVYLCSSSTPPGGGVHGLCGHYAARAL